MGAVLPRHPDWGNPNPSPSSIPERHDLCDPVADPAAVLQQLDEEIDGIARGNSDPTSFDSWRVRHRLQFGR